MWLGACAILSVLLFTTSQVYGASPPECYYAVTNGGDYRGVVRATESGLECQRWDTQSPHRHNYTQQAYPLSGLEQNFCRNPDGRNRPWCHTTDPSVRFQYCNISLCEFQFHQFNGHFYKFVTNPSTFQQADEFCIGEGGFLASIHSQEEQDFAWSIVAPADGWIGLTVTFTQVEAWTDGTQVDFTRWHPGEPRYNLPVACTALWGASSGNWDDRGCTATTGFVCKKEVDKCASGIVTCPSGFFCDNSPGDYSCYCTFGYYRDDGSCEAFRSCPEGWTQLEDSCFKVFNETLSYADARTSCSRVGARLAAVSNSSSYRFVTDLEKEGVDEKSDFWIGLVYDSSISAFVTSDGVTIETDPSWGLWAQYLWTWNETSGCGHLSPGNENVTIFNVSTCDVARPYICETLLTQKDDCTPSPCVNAQSCEDQWDAFICHCKEGWTGDLCDIDIDECVSAPCLYDAPCNNHLGGFECDCPAGYTGQICSDDINECASSPCQNDGLCVDMTDYYTCTCTDDYMGGRCQTSTKGTAGWVIALSVILPIILLAVLACIVIAALKRRKRRKGVSPAVSRRSVSEEETNNSNGVVTKGTGEK